MEQPKKPIPLTPAMRMAVILKITKAAHKNPEYKKHAEAKLKEVSERESQKPKE